MQQRKDLNKAMPKLKIINGGKDDGDRIDTKVWIKDLEVGHVFLIKDRQSADYVLPEFEVVSKVFEKDKLVAVQLCTSLNSEIWVHVDPVFFCQKFNLVKITGKIDNYD